jgi:hypothetical protein
MNAFGTRPRRSRIVLLAGVAAILAFLAGRAVANSLDRTWPNGIVNVYDASGMTETVATAAHRWTISGADVTIRVVDDERDADVVVRSDDRRLARECGDECLGYSTSIGRPRDGQGEVLLHSDFAGTPRPLSVWVAAHELGHVLGLEHRDARRCTVMSARAFDSLCAPSHGTGRPTDRQLACVPAPADVAAAAARYGGAATGDPRCR